MSLLVKQSAASLQRGVLGGTHPSVSEGMVRRVLVGTVQQIKMDPDYARNAGASLSSHCSPGGSCSALEGRVVKLQCTRTDGGDDSRHQASSFSVLLDNPHQLAPLSAGFSHT